jgi:hypothetical protein
MAHAHFLCSLEQGINVEAVQTTLFHLGINVWSNSCMMAKAGSHECVPASRRACTRKKERMEPSEGSWISDSDFHVHTKGTSERAPLHEIQGAPRQNHLVGPLCSRKIASYGQDPSQQHFCVAVTLESARRARVGAAPWTFHAMPDVRSWKF